jgi:signal transduction histidine kinase
MSSTSLAGHARSNVRTTIRAIAIVVGILIVAMWAAVELSLVDSRRAALDAVRSDGRNLTIAFREQVAFILGGLEGEMNLIAERMRREHGNFNLYAWGQQNVLVTPGLAQVSILDPNGHLSSTTIEAHPRSTDFSDRPQFRVHLDGKFHGLYIGQTVGGRILVGASLLPISLRVDAEDGTFLGVVVVLISPSRLTTLHTSIHLGAYGVMALSGLDDVIRARFAADSPDGTKGIGNSIAGGPRPTVIEENALDSFLRVSVIDGVNRLYTYGRVGSYPLVVTVGLALDHELAAWSSLAAMIVIVALGATLLLIGLAAYLIHEIRIRAAHEDKLATTNVVLTKSMERVATANLAKTQFLANMSHELRTPLNAIIGFSEILTAGVPGQLNSKQQGYVGYIHDGGELLLHIINDVLDLAQVDAGTLKLNEDEGIEVGRFADSCIALVREQANVADLRLSLEIVDRALFLIADPTRLKQILLNLLSNAIKFTDPGGSVTLAIHRATDDGIAFEVRDTGLGMTAAEVEVALQPFGQVDSSFSRRHNGTGLGLPLARTLAELHGGSLLVDSEKGRGTTVTVLLPASRVSADAAASMMVAHAA